MAKVDPPVLTIRDAVQPATVTLHEGAPAPSARFVLLLAPTAGCRPTG